MTPSPQPAERRTVVYGGHVQGVGFRYTARDIASRYRVSGYVMNLPDGRVELVAEGTEGELGAFLQEIAVTLDHRIDQAQQVRGPAAGGFDRFEIRVY